MTFIATATVYDGIIVGADSRLIDEDTGRPFVVTDKAVKIFHLKHANCVIAMAGNYQPDMNNLELTVSKFMEKFDKNFVGNVAPDVICSNLMQATLFTHLKQNDFVIAKYFANIPYLFTIRKRKINRTNVVNGNILFGGNIMMGKSEVIVKLLHYDKSNPQSIIRPSMSLSEAADVIKFEINKTIEAKQHRELTPDVGGLPQIYQITKSRIAKV